MPGETVHAETVQRNQRIYLRIVSRRQGRLTETVRYDAATDRYLPISWDAAFALALCSRNWVTLCRAKNLASTRRLVASQLTALAPFSQNLTAPDSGESPQAQPGQSKPPCRLVLSKALMLLMGCSLFSHAWVTLSNAPQPAAGPL